VLFYTTFYGAAAWNADFTSCAHICRFTTNKSDLSKSDAVLFDAIETRNRRIRIPPRGPKLWNQIRAFAIIESPAVFTTRFNMHIFDNAFNWSISYRKDSDVPLPSRHIIPLTNQNQALRHEIPTRNSIKGKKLVAGMISRCGAESGRDAYIAELQKYIPVDMYGDCGNLTCDKSLNCYQILAKYYKFWLSFENSLCQEYVTEKFFEPLTNGVIPVVFGSGPYHEIVPKGSYIDIRDFETPRALAEYLQRLASEENVDEYLKHFSWMKRFRIPTGDENNQQFWCNLCAKLHDPNLVKNRKWYSDPGSWYRTNYTNTSLCTKPSEIRINYRKP